MGSTKRRSSLKKGTVVKIVVAVVLVAAAILALVLVLRSHVSEQYADNDTADVKTAEVTTGSITTTISGTGTLANEESDDLFISDTVDVTEVYVSAGDNVKKGDMLASVNSASVLKAMKEVQDDIDSIDEEIAALEEEEVSSSITAGVNGRVKNVYVATGDSVIDVMYEKNALMLLSADGYMAVDVQVKGSSLAKGDSVTVTLDDGNAYEGTVDAVWANNATVLIPDDEAANEAQATVTKDNDAIGTGKLYIHEQVAVTGFTGSVDAVNVSENDYVSTGEALLTLSGTSSTVNYATLLEKRSKLEDELKDLVVIHKEGAVYAQSNGMVTAISETEDSTTTTTTARTSSGSGSGSNAGGSGSGGSSSQTSGQQTTTTTVTVADDSDKPEDGTTISICPTDLMTVKIDVDETDILALEVGQTADVTVTSLGDETYSAKITELDTVGTSSDGVTTYTATLTLDKVDGMLDGMSASAVIIIEGKENALLVPVEAVHKTSSTAYVYTSYDEQTKEFGDMVEVVVGLSNDKFTEISKGLSAGDTVYYEESEENARRSGPGGEMGGMFGMGNSGGGRPPGGNSGGGRPSGGGNRS